MISRIAFSLNKILGQLVGRRNKQGLSMSKSPKKGKGKVETGAKAEERKRQAHWVWRSRRVNRWACKCRGQEMRHDLGRLAQNLRKGFL